MVKSRPATVPSSDMAEPLVCRAKTRRDFREDAHIKARLGTWPDPILVGCNRSRTESEAGAKPPAPRATAPGLHSTSVAPSVLDLPLNCPG